MKQKSDLEKAAAALPPNPRKARIWSLEEDAVVLKYSEEKGFNAIARLLDVNPILVRRRYELLKKGIRR
jgi:hypothetical protein